MTVCADMNANPRVQNLQHFLPSLVKGKMNKPCISVLLNWDILSATAVIFSPSCIRVLQPDMNASPHMMAISCERHHFAAILRLLSRSQQQQRERELRKQHEREQRRRYEEMEQLRREEERRHAEREQVGTSSCRTNDKLVSP